MSSPKVQFDPKRLLAIAVLTTGLFLTVNGCDDDPKAVEPDMPVDIQNPTNGLRSITVGSRTREYRLYVPDSYDEASAVPLLLNFHGYTQTAREQMEDISDMRALAESENFILIYPQGRSFQGETHWNVGSWTQGSTSNDIGFIDVLIEEMAANYNIDRTRIYACGYSNGGFFSYELACQLSDHIAAIGTVAANMSLRTRDMCNPTHPTPVITISGTGDPIVHYDGTSPVATISHGAVMHYWVTFNNGNINPTIVTLPDRVPSDGTIVEFHEFADGDQGVAVHHYRVLRGGHDWPGSFGNMDIDANQLIWDFVSQYDLNGKI
ncbi:MAG: PHB depolymerase family esterase [Bacteroidota bacterium]